MKIIGSFLLVLMCVSVALAATDSPPLATAGGQISSIDSAAGTFTLKVVEPKGGDSHEVTFVLADDSKIVKGGAAVGLGDLKEGEKVTVTYHAQDGKNVVVNVGVEPAA